MRILKQFKPEALENARRGGVILMRRICLSVLIPLLVSCGVNGTLPNKDPALMDNTRESADKLLSAAALAETEGDMALAERSRLNAAKILVNIGELSTAERIYSDIQVQRLNPEQLINYSLAYSDLSLATGEYYVARRLLTSPEIESTQSVMTPEQEQRWRANRAGTFTLTGESILAIKEHLAMMDLVTDPQSIQANSDHLWQLLLSLPDTTLAELSTKESNPTLRGWYSLASLSKNNQANLEEQLRQFTHWQNQWSSHPAAINPPRDLQLLEQLVREQPKQVAVLLPLTGKLSAAGLAVREGFLAAYYSASQAGQMTPKIRFYNTDQVDINSIYDQAVADGAEAVIGPLEKEPLETLNLRPALPVPTLALNYLIGDSLHTENLFQFGLAPEDEARLIAEQAWRDGNRRAMILASDREWGKRSAAAFKDAWEGLGGQLAVYSEFSLQKDFSKIIEHSMLVDRSKQRAREIENLMGMNMETVPRSRGDVDMIFMVAQPEDARQLKPTLAFHYAGDIPVYATGHLYEPDAGRSANSDLNGIRFTSLPWNFGFSKLEHDELAKLFPNLRNVQNLQAMGVDAYRLYPRVRQLQQVSQARYYGATGELYLTSSGRMARQPSLAIVKLGIAELLPVVSEEFVAN